MYYYMKIGQFPNISVNSDIIVDSSPKPDVVYDEVKKLADALRTKGRNVNVFNLSDIKRSNGFLHFVSEYLIEVNLGKEAGILEWNKYSKAFVERMWSLDKKTIDELGLNSKIDLFSINRKKKNNGFPICKI
jgi:hypothetical protein